MRHGLAAAILLVASATAGGTRTPARFAILPEAVAAAVLNQCSRPTAEIDGSWTVTERDAAQLEADLPRLNGMKAKGCCIRGEGLRNADSYYRQYVGIVRHGRRFIYINAFPADTFDQWPADAPKPDWQHEPFNACDGGSAYWGVLYDPVTRRFSELAFNGIG